MSGATGGLEVLAWGYGLLEGPRADAHGNLYLSDVPNGGVYGRSRGGSIETVVPKRRGVGGIALHADGGIVVSGRNIAHVVDGRTRVVFVPDSPGCNDLFTDPAGRILCGTIRSDPFSTGGERVPGECWRVDAEGMAVPLYGEVSLSNGMGLSPDGAVLYYADTAVSGVWAHDYGVDGRVQGRRLVVQRDDLRPTGSRSTRPGPSGWPTCRAPLRCAASRRPARRWHASRCRPGW